MSTAVAPQSLHILKKKKNMTVVLACFCTEADDKYLCRYELPLPLSTRVVGMGHASRTRSFGFDKVVQQQCTFHNKKRRGTNVKMCFFQPCVYNKNNNVKRLFISIQIFVTCCFSVQAHLPNYRFIKYFMVGSSPSKLPLFQGRYWGI